MMITKIKFNIVGACLLCLPLFSQGVLAASKYEYSDEGSYSLNVEDALGDLTLRIRMRVKWKTWTILGEPVVNCWQNWTAGSGMGEGGGGGSNYIKVGNDSLEFFWGELPEEVRRKTRVNVEAYLIQSDRLNGYLGTAFVCQNGIDAGAGKWSWNIPASPNWNKFLTDGSVFNYQFNEPRKSMTALYRQAASQGYLSTDAAKKLYKNFKSYEDYETKILPAGASIDSYYIRKWAVKQIAAKKADKVEQAKKKAATESLNQLDDLFSDFPEEGGTGSAGSSLGQLDGLFEEFPEEQQARRADEARQLKAELKASEDQHNKFVAKQKKKERQFRGWEVQLSEVKKGKRKVKKGSSDTRQRYLALFKPKYSGTISVSSVNNNQSFQKNVVKVSGSVSRSLIGKGILQVNVNGYTQHIGVSHDGGFSSPIVLAAGNNSVKFEFIANNSKEIAARKNLNLSYEGRRTRLRATLTWDGSSSDIDLHVKGPAGHCYYSNKSVGNMSLDVDNKSGYGPENISTYPGYPGSYSIEVVNFSKGRGDTASVYIYVDERLESVKTHTFRNSKETWSVDTIVLN
ncbi:hypothetical protein D8Y20_03215 [Mariprofundus sp. EBB-1]|uniref:YfaP family protein n=1 Tax=Mariprofundus sp. EBB-1 TaxID=2650971 RepID=UPI000EF25F9A|nr:hypothetical protein [Mariprofundus sp. EBB-1]RLL54299.1 hypothetical protein D8Y20_03215 [Mariprofundus sp. EBB-1]